MPAGVLIVNLAVLGAVLLADLGTKQITWRRVLRPVVVSAIAIAVFVKSPQTSGRGLVLELAGLAVGLVLGTAGSVRLMVIRRDRFTATPVTEAGPAYAAFWIVIIGLRLTFTYGANHWYTHALGTWLIANRITVNGLTDALILLAIGMVLARVARFARFLNGSRGHPGWIRTA